MDFDPYLVTHAPTGKASCKTCNTKIEKGALKVIVVSQGFGDYTMEKGFHSTCFKLPRKLISDGVTPEMFVDEFLVDRSKDGDILSSQETRDQLLHDLEAAVAAKKSKTEGGGDNEPMLMDRLKTAASDIKAPANDNGDDEEDSKPPAAKKAKTEDSYSKGKKDPKADFDDMLALYHKYSKMKADELKDYLRWNMQMLKGTKQFVMFKCIDGEVNGRLGFCPLCQGQLKYDDTDYEATVHCSGRYDEDMGRRVACSYKVGRLDSNCPRLLPWFTAEPSEEEKEAMEKVKEEARGESEGGDYDNQPVAAELLKAAADLELNLDTMPGKKEAATQYAALVEGKLDIPEGRNATMEVGRVVMSNLENSPKDIMQSIISKFGIKEVKEAKAAKKEAAAESACANPKNAPLILAFKECSKYYFEEGNANAGSTYVKAISTLMDLEEEVTEDNAISFSKGKTKLPGIGKGTAEKMSEFAKTGTFAKLEEKRSSRSSASRLGATIMMGATTILTCIGTVDGAADAADARGLMEFHAKVNTVELVLIVVVSAALAAAAGAVTWKLVYGHWPFPARLLQAVRSMADNNDGIELGLQQNAPLVAPHPTGGGEAAVVHQRQPQVDEYLRNNDPADDRRGTYCFVARATPHFVYLRYSGNNVPIKKSKAQVNLHYEYIEDDATIPADLREIHART
mmetsp:Transcript_34957/g.84593  ORF Transcript_34957/g.84593 Transcript_34957/m.84593 type:complete len:683 (+) Transcript_34957:164-2212(+)